MLVGKIGKGLKVWKNRMADAWTFKTWKDAMAAVWVRLILPSMFVGVYYTLLHARSAIKVWSTEADAFVIVLAVNAAALIFAVMHRVGDTIDQYERGSPVNPIARGVAYIALGFFGLIVLAAAGVSALWKSGMLQITFPP